MHDAVLRLLCGVICTCGFRKTGEVDFRSGLGGAPFPLPPAWFPRFLGKKTFGGRISGRILGDVTESSMSG